MTDSTVPDTDPMPEQTALVDQAMRGSVDAFEELVRQQYAVVYAIGIGYLKSREAAEELTQEVFLRAYIRLQTLRSPELFSGWLVRMTRNLALDWHRSRRRASALVRMVPLDDEAVSVPDPQQVADERLVMQEEHSELQRAVFALPRDERDVVLLHYAEQLSKSEIARRLQVHPSTVGRRLGKALFTLRIQLDQNLRIGLHSLRSQRDARTRAAAVIAAVALLPKSAQAAVAAKAATGATLGSLLYPTSFFSAAVRIRKILAGAKEMVTPTRLLAGTGAIIVFAALAYLRPSDAQAQVESAPAEVESIVSSVMSKVVTSTEPAPKLSGNDKTETRSVETFKAVRLAGASNVLVQVGAPSPRVEVTADDQLLPFVETTTENGELRIQLKCASTGSNKVNVKVETPELEAVSIAGSGKIEVADLSTKHFNVSIAGSGNVVARGTAESVNAKVAGSGDVDLLNVVAKNASAHMTGSGNIGVNASDSVDAKITGSGIVEYTGTVTNINKKITGSGKVRPKS